MASTNHAVDSIRTSTKAGSKAQYLIMGNGKTDLANGRHCTWNIERQIRKESGAESDKVFVSVKVSDAHGEMGYFGGSFKGSIDDASALLGEAVALDILDAVSKYESGKAAREGVKKAAEAKARRLERIRVMIQDRKDMGLPEDPALTETLASLLT